jgi:hypothetical protein
MAPLASAKRKKCSEFPYFPRVKFACYQGLAATALARAASHSSQLPESAKTSAFHLTPPPRDCALNCSLILRTATPLQPRARKILGVRALRAAFRIIQDSSSSSHALPSRLRLQLLGSTKIPALHLTYHPRDFAHNCSLILRSAIALSDRSLERIRGWWRAGILADPCS